MKHMQLKLSVVKWSKHIIPELAKRDPFSYIEVKNVGLLTAVWPCVFVAKLHGWSIYTTKIMSQCVLPGRRCKDLDEFHQVAVGYHQLVLGNLHWLIILGQLEKGSQFM
jgi:hypothetical protein